ncbi:MAG: hypothetical protein H7Z72_15870 [Bacteroidetes bacterium]|nr:hypothetical protein [Fibrella sp.]
MKNSSIRLHALLGSLAACALVLNGCNDPNSSSTAPANGRGARLSATSYVVYVGNNVPYADNNAILAYEWIDEKFVTIPGSPFKTTGKGMANFKQTLGPNDSDQCLAFSADRKRMFAVNSGSNTIAVFNVNADGTLTAVSGSPFPSGGINPVSLGVRDNLLFVVNKNDDPEQPNAGKPNYTSFTIGANGSLTPVPGSTLETVAKATPAHAYVAPNKNLVFGADFLAFMSPTPAGTLRAFTIDAQGKLNPSPGTPKPIDGMGGALG